MHIIEEKQKLNKIIFKSYLQELMNILKLKMEYIQLGDFMLLIVQAVVYQKLIILIPTLFLKQD